MSAPCPFRLRNMPCPNGDNCTAAATTVPDPLHPEYQPTLPADPMTRVWWGSSDDAWYFNEPVAVAPAPPVPRPGVNHRATWVYNPGPGWVAGRRGR